MTMMTTHCACHEKLFPVPQLHYKLATSESSSEKLFPALDLYYKLATPTSESSSETLFPALHLYYKLATSESSSKSEAPSLQNERFVRDFLQKSRVKVSKASVSCETSSKS